MTGALFCLVNLGVICILDVIELTEIDTAPELMKCTLPFDTVAYYILILKT